MQSENEIVYDVLCTINWGNTVDSIGALMGEINAALATFGTNVKYDCIGNFRMQIICNRELTSIEEYRMKIAISSAFLEHLSKYDIRIESIRRQPSNSRNQSVNP